jgi:hypothetical protein
MMTIADRKAIGDHVRARESSGEFRTALEAAYAVIRDIEEYQQMAVEVRLKLPLTLWNFRIVSKDFFRE